VEVVASLSQGRTAAAQCGLFTHKSVPVVFEPPCTCRNVFLTCNAGFNFINSNKTAFELWSTFLRPLMNTALQIS